MSQLDNDALGVRKKEKRDKGKKERKRETISMAEVKLKSPKQGGYLADVGRKFLARADIGFISRAIDLRSRA